MKALWTVILLLALVAIGVVGAQLQVFGPRSDGDRTVRRCRRRHGT